MTYPDLSKEPYIQFDIETYDPNLLKKGTGVYRKDGFILGVAISGAPGSPSEYYSLNHIDTTRSEAEKNKKYLTDILGSQIPKLGTNIKYDLDWLENFEGIKVNGRLHDIQIAAPLLDEYRFSYSLENLAQDLLGESKKNDLPFKWALSHGLPVKKRSDAVKYLKDMPYNVVRPYALGDVDLPGRIFEIQKRQMEEQGLIEIYDLECKVIRVLLQMRKTGVRLDVDRLYRVGMAIKDEVYLKEQKLFKQLGRKVNIKSTKDKQWILDKFGLEYPHNPPTKLMREKGVTKGNPCIDKNVLKSLKHWSAQAILELTHLKQLDSLYIGPYMDLLVGDRIHCDFQQLRADDSGTVSGRFSGKNPNLQQVSAKKEDEEDVTNPLLKGKIIRDLFIPEEGCVWNKNDWSQIEYRLISHYAMGPGADLIREKYQNDPKTDYHSEVQRMAGFPMDEEYRKLAKTLNFGIAYSMGPSRMAKTYSWDLEYAKELHTLYHSKVPFVRYTSNRVAAKAKQTGFVFTLLKRRARLDKETLKFLETRDKQYKDRSYVMFNRLIQGSAADLMKLAMVQAYEKGLFDTLPLHITVHDELDVSMPKTKEGFEVALELKNTMENCVKLRVPIISDAEYGKTWGSLSPLEEFKI